MEGAARDKGQPHRRRLSRSTSQRLGLKPAFAEDQPGDEKGAAAGEHTGTTRRVCRRTSRRFRGPRAIASESVLSLNTRPDRGFQAGSESTRCWASRPMPTCRTRRWPSSATRPSTGKDGAKYSSYSKSENLNGKVADHALQSPWTQDARACGVTPTPTSGWSPPAWRCKPQSAIQRGVSAIIVINTPGADDERVRSSTRPRRRRTGAANSTTGNAADLARGGRT